MLVAAALAGGFDVGRQRPDLVDRTVDDPDPARVGSARDHPDRRWSTSSRTAGGSCALGRQATGRAISRRTVLAAGGMIALGAVAWGGANLLDVARGGVRRFTGSRWLPPGGIPPPTTFYGEGTPPIDAAAWRLRVTGRVARELILDRAAMDRLGVEARDATLDCTSGWAMTTTWDGTPLVAVLAAAGADPDAPRVIVRSITGWSVALNREEIAASLLATHVAGAALPAANGAPCRLVIPTRRGLDWIKWVDEIRVA